MKQYATKGQSDPEVIRLLDCAIGSEDTSPGLRDEVARMQTLLREHGLTVEPDGLFGSGTEGVVKAFQRLHGLDDDGVVGPRTWAMLSGEPQPTAGSVDFPTTLPPSPAGLTAELAASARYRKVAEAAADQYHLPRCLIAGIASRESGWGLMLKPAGPGGTGDMAPRGPKPPIRTGPRPPDGGGFGRGIMQIDYDSHPFARSGQWADPAANLLYGASVLSQNRAFLSRSTSLVGIPLLRAALSAYNCGAGNVLKAIQKNADVDFFTTGRDYGRDTLNRSGWFRQKGWI